MRGVVGILLLALAGCVPGAAALLLPEQRQLDLRTPPELPSARLPDVPPPATIAKPVPAGDRQPMSLDDAIRTALTNSKVVRTLAGATAVSSGQTIYDPAISNTTIDDARAAFDPVLQVNNHWNRIETPRAVGAAPPLGAGIFGSSVDQYDLTTSLTKRNVVGGTLGLDFNHKLSHLAPGIFPLNPEERSALALSYTQPLL